MRRHGARCSGLVGDRGRRRTAAAARRRTGDRWSARQAATGPRASHRIDGCGVSDGSTARERLDQDHISRRRLRPVERSRVADEVHKCATAEGAAAGAAGRTACDRSSRQTPGADRSRRERRADRLHRRPARADGRRHRRGARVDRGTRATERRTHGDCRDPAGEIRRMRSVTRVKFNIIALTVTVLVAVAALQTVDLWWRWDRMIAAAETRARHLAVVFAEYIRESFTSADAALRQIVIHGQRVGGYSAPDDMWHPILTAAKAALSESGSISVTDPKGVIAHSTLPSLKGKSRRDDYLFTHLASSPSDQLVVDRPYRVPGSQGQYIIPLGRRMLNDAGRFDGAVVATLIPEQYRDFFRNVNVGSESLITVIHPDGVVLFREPSQSNPINEKATDSPLFALARVNGSGVFRG